MNIKIRCDIKLTYKHFSSTLEELEEIKAFTYNIDEINKGQCHHNVTKKYV